MIELLHYVTLFRTLWLSGRYGGGKTALAVHLAFMLCKNDYAENIVSNIELAGTPTAILTRDQLFDLRDCAMVLDESWLMLGQGTSNSKVQEWLAYLRKSNLYMLLPSVMPLAKQVSHLVVERELSLMPLGLPLWIYRWRLTTGGTTKRAQQLGRVYWYKPASVFNLYNHEDRPGERYYYYGSADSNTAGSEEISGSANDD